MVLIGANSVEVAMAKAKRRIRVNFGGRIQLENIYGRDYAFNNVDPSVSIEDEADDGESEQAFFARITADCQAMYLELTDAHLAVTKKLIDEGAAGARQRRKDRREERRSRPGRQSSSSKGVPW